MRVTTVESARKDQGRCIRCSSEIAKGESYRWAKGRYGPRRAIHAKCGQFKQSELTDNDKLNQLYAAVESVDDWIANTKSEEIDIETFLDDAKQALEEAADQIEEVAEMYREIASNIEDGFGHATFASEEAESNADEVESFASDVRDALGDIEEFDEDTIRTEFNDEIEDDDEYAIGEFDSMNDQATYITEKTDERIEEKREAWIDEVLSAMSDAVSACPL